jgi:hypothetical protein
MKRLLSLSNDGTAFLCAVCDGLFTPGEKRPELTATQGLRHLALYHAADWLLASGWIKDRGHNPKPGKDTNTDADE